MKSSRLPDGRRLLLASSSPFRRQLLARLQLPFQVVAPTIDETAYPEEAGKDLVARLAEHKARCVAQAESGVLVIGSDQVASFRNEIITKPGNHKNAVAQLTQFSSQSVVFYTGVCVLDSTSGSVQVKVIPTHVLFRSLTQQQIENYLEREQPYQCAGSFKAEGLGIALFEKVQGEDPTSLIGLPLIQLTRMLETVGVQVL